MSETQRPLSNTRAGSLIAGAFVLLAIVFAFKRLTPPPEPLTIKETPDSPQDRGVDRPPTRL